MRGGLSAFSPSSFSGAANAPYHQFLTNQPVSFNYSVGSPVSYQNSALANPPGIANIVNNCSDNTHGLVGKGLLN
jgi:hypothetical protein